MLTLAEIADALENQGLVLRGAFHPEKEDAVPPLGNGRPTATLVLAGNAGPALWRAYAPHRGATALDDWCAAALSEIAGRFDATVLLPQDGPPFLPFPSWAQRAEPVAPSPLGILIHPDYGLWHGYRGALAFAERLKLPPLQQHESPCRTCEEKPCLSTCPVGAFTEKGYDVAACVRHLETPAGADCMEQGCRARRACPVGRGYTYAPPQAAFHMTAFIKAQQKHHA
jgi:hypothetical protein